MNLALFVSGKTTKKIFWTCLSLFSLLCVFNQEAEASHFRFGTVNWEPTGKAGEVRFRIIGAFRRNFYPGTAPDGFPQIGDVIEDVAIEFGDDQFISELNFVVISVSLTENIIIGEAIDPVTKARGILHTYIGAGPFTAIVSDCCRISTLNNRSDGNYALETIVTPQNGNRNAVTSLVPIVRVAPGSASSFLVPAVDPDGDRLRWRLSTDAEAGGGPHPPNLSVDSATGRVTWNNTGLDQNDFWTTQIMIEDLDANGNVKSKTPIDFFLKIEAAAGQPPTCSIDPVGPFTVNGGTPVSFRVTATDPDAGDTITLNTGGLPNGANMSPALPVTGASGVNSVFNWTPGAGQAGSFVIIYSATDSKAQQSLCSTRITVNAGNVAADIGVTQTAAPNPADAGSKITYTINLANPTTAVATNVTFTNQLPIGLTFQSLTAPAGWNCVMPQVGANGTITCSAASLAANSNAMFSLVANVGCQVADGTTITNTVSASAANDSNQANNQASSSVTARKSQLPVRITLNGGKSTFDFGSTPASREITSNTPSDTFTIENSGCSPVTVKLQRTGADVASGKIVNPDDSAIFSLFIINANGTETAVQISPGAPPLQLTGGQTQTFRLRFHPLIPILSGKTTGLFANQAIPDVITSQLIIAQDGGTPTTINVTARVATPLQLIHPTDSRLAPLIVFTRTALEYTVECSVHDPNLDVYLARYQFLDQNDRPLGLPADVDLVQPIAQRGLVRGQSFTIIQKFAGSLQSNVAKVQVTLLDREATVTSARTPLGTAEAVVSNVSAASYQASGLASESMAAAFGSNLSPGTQVATNVPLPTSLGGTSVRVRDGAGVERSAPLFFVSPTQVNYQIPPGTRVGAGTVSLMRVDQTIAREVVQIAAAAPALFSANSNGQGVAAAVALRISANGTQRFDPIARFDQSRNQFVSLPLAFGPSNEQLFLVVFGAGVRFRNSGGQLSAKVGGIDAPIYYAGSQGSFVGLDQVNILLPRTLAGRGEVDVVLTLDGKQSNAVKVNFGGSSSATMSLSEWLDVASENEDRRRAEMSNRNAEPGTLPILHLPIINLPTPARNNERDKGAKK